MDGWYFATAFGTANEHEVIRELPVHPDDLNAGLVIPQYEPVAVRDGYIRPFYSSPDLTGVVLSIENPFNGRFAGFPIDSPYDDDGNPKTERKICIIRDGRVILPAVIDPPADDWMVEGKNCLFVLNRETIQGEKHVVAYIPVTGEPYGWNYWWLLRAGLCRVTKLRRFWVGGSRWWIHQAVCSFHPSLVFAWEGY